MGTLSALTGLVLSLWVFDQIFDAVAPSLWSCANASYSVLSNATLSQAQCVWNNGTANFYASGVSGYFGTSLSFVQDILPVVGIIAGYIMIRVAIRRMNY